MDRELPKRKPNRLDNYDYSSDGAYFITICVTDMKCVLGKINVGATIGRPYEMYLSEIGKIVDEAINGIPKHYDAVFVDKYVVMPNHIHLLLRVTERNGPPGRAVPTKSVVSDFVGTFKRFTDRKIGINIWQGRSYDHIIRDDKDYLKIAEYIENNPYKWKEDCFYCE